MVNIIDLYNYILSKNKIEKENIINLYNYLQLNKKLESITTHENKKKFIKNLDKDNKKLYKILKNKMSISKYEKMLHKYKQKKIKKLIYIKNNIKNYTENNINDLLLLNKQLKNINVKIHNESFLEDNRLTFIEIKNNIIKWWSWITEDDIKNIIEENEENKKINLINNIIETIILIDNIELIEYNINKLIITDIKNTKKINIYEHGSLINCYNFINDNLIKLNNNLNESFEVLDKDIIHKYLIENRLLYNIKDDTIVFSEINNNIEDYEKLNKTYNIFTNIDIILKDQINKKKDITMTDKLYKYIVEFNEMINNITYFIDKQTQNDILNINSVDNIDVDNIDNMNIKDKYNIFILDLHKILNNIYEYYLENRIDKNSKCYKCLCRKHNIMNKLFV